MTQRIAVLLGAGLVALLMGTGAGATDSLEDLVEGTADEAAERACWAHTSGAVHTSVCFRSGGEGVFALMWTTGTGPGRSVGSCIGDAEILFSEGAIFEWQVPTQGDRCYQDARFARMARRNYDCVVTADRMTCVLRIYLDDGTQWGDTETGVVLLRR